MTRIDFIKELKDVKVNFEYTSYYVKNSFSVNCFNSSFNVRYLGDKTGKLVFNYEYSKTYTYDGSITYNKIPVIGASVEDENVLIYITNLSTTSVTIESSSSFTGIVHLQVYKDES